MDYFPLTKQTIRFINIADHNGYVLKPAVVAARVGGDDRAGFGLAKVEQIEGFATQPERGNSGGCASIGYAKQVADGGTRYVLNTN